jgi:transposase-like protein
VLRIEVLDPGVASMLVELGVLEQRYQAVLEVLNEGLPIVEVAARFGVTRQSVHRWLKRYAAQGLAGLVDASNGAGFVSASDGARDRGADRGDASRASGSSPKRRGDRPPRPRQPDGDRGSVVTGVHRDIVGHQACLQLLDAVAQSGVRRVRGLREGGDERTDVPGGQVGRSVAEGGAYAGLQYGFAGT